MVAEMFRHGSLNGSLLMEQRVVMCTCACTHMAILFLWNFSPTKKNFWETSYLSVRVCHLQGNQEHTIMQANGPKESWRHHWGVSKMATVQHWIVDSTNIRVHCKLIEACTYIWRERNKVAWLIMALGSTHVILRIQQSSLT